MKLSPSTILNSVYSTGISTTSITKPNLESQILEQHDDNIHSKPDDDSLERILLSKSSGRLIAESLEIPELAVEIERAVGQVEKSLEAEELERQEKRQPEVVNEEVNSKR